MSKKGGGGRDIPMQQLGDAGQSHPHALLEFYENTCASQQLRPLESLREQLQKHGDEARPLESIHLKGESLASKREAFCVAELVKINPFLTTLNLQETDLGDKGCIMICQALLHQKKVVRLDLSYNGIEKDGGKAIGNLMRKCPSLLVLDLTGNFLNSSMAPVFKEVLGATGSKVQMLRFGDNDFDTKGISALTEGLRKNNTVKNLHLPDNKIDPRMSQSISNLLATNSTLTNLDLRYNRLQDHGAAALSSALKTNNTLLGLVLWGNDIHEQGMSSLALMLAENKTLQSLDVGLNPIGVNGAVALKEALPKNRSISTLGLASTEIGNEGAVAIAEGLEGAKSLLHLDIRRNGIGMAGVMALHLAMKMNVTLCTLAMVSRDDPKIEDPMELEMRQFIDEKCKQNTANNPVVQKKLAAQQGRRSVSRPGAPSKTEGKPSPLNPAREGASSTTTQDASEAKAEAVEAASKDDGDSGNKDEKADDGKAGLIEGAETN